MREKMNSTVSYHCNGCLCKCYIEINSQFDYKPKKCLLDGSNRKWYSSQKKIKKITKAEAFDILKNIPTYDMKLINAALEKHFGQKVEIID